MADATTRGSGSRWRRLLRWCFRGGCLAVLLLGGIHQCVYWSSGTIHTAASAPQRDVILVLGASVWRNGQPSRMLGERLQATLELYRAGKGRKILVSGDHGRRDYDEVSVMAAWLEERGVPAADIFLDHAGFRTLDSAARARRVFGVESALVVTNPFHVPRAVFLARAAGIDAAGVGADYGVKYSSRTVWRNRLREAAARILAFLDVHVLGTRPRFLGPRIDITGDGRVTRDR